MLRKVGAEDQAVRVQALVDAAQDEMPRYLTRLAELVGIDSGSDDPGGVDAAGRVTAGYLSQGGFTVEFQPVEFPDGRPAGGVVIGRRVGDQPQGRRILLVGHLDTVFDRGTAAERPAQFEADRAYGPGVSDDKGGLLAGIAAADVLAAVGSHPYRELIVCLTGDEEIGSLAGGPVLRRVAAEVDVALCLECARVDGSIVAARKGAADVVVSVTGRAAHAGIDAAAGVNAALAAAHLTVTLQAMNDPDEGISVNVGVIRAGRRPNVVAERADVVADVRATTRQGFGRLLAAAQELAGSEPVPGAVVQVELRAVVPPMEATTATVDLADAYCTLAAGIGHDIAAVGTGGVADANLIADLGVPVLDGLGPIGGDDHAPTEWLDLTSVPVRVGLLAALIEAIGPSATP